MTQNSLSSWLKIIMELGKVRISLPVALSALVGYSLKTNNLAGEAWMLMIGVFLMSCSSAAINHIQEYKTDALMPRTRKRPIPSGKISLRTAIIIAFLFFAYATVILLSSFPPIVFFVSLLTLVSYNLIYTPLKKVTAFAVVPGSLVGALPPYIGWFAGGGALMDERIAWVALFFFIGQIPHFWLLLLMFGKEYTLAGYPSLNAIFTDHQIKRLSYTWILVTIASAFLVSIKVIEGSTTLFFLLIYIFYLLFSLTAGILVKKDIPVRISFLKLNFLYLLMMILLIMDSLF
ncbi:MAG TPA: protoheme IX farnesyltransferase [Prolixibacteraceae bacterium]|nr:protoheme IX farnesyltransferase [Prolixibacteraceae bacterium]